MHTDQSKGADLEETVLVAKAQRHLADLSGRVAMAGKPSPYAANRWLVEANER